MYRSAVLTLVLFAATMTGMANAADAPAANGLFVSIRDAYVGPEEFPSIVEGLRHLGLDAIELNLGKDYSVSALDSQDRVTLDSDDAVKQYRRRADELGVKIWAVMTARDFSVGDMAENAGYIARAIEIADLLGAAAVRIDSAMSKERELSFETRVKLFAEGLGGALQKTPSSKVTLGIENHGFQGNNLAFLLNTFLQVGSDRLGSTMDVGNFYWRGYPLSEVYGILNLLAPHAKHTHVKSIHYPEDQREVTREAGWEYGKYFSPFDEGDIDLAKVVSLLLKAGYKGDLCIEDESVSKCKTREERVAVLERDVASLRKAIAEGK